MRLEEQATKGSVGHIKKLGLFKEIMLNNFKLENNGVR